MITAAAVSDLQRRLPSRLRLPNILRAAGGCGRRVRSLHKKWMNVISELSVCVAVVFWLLYETSAWTSLGPIVIEADFCFVVADILSLISTRRVCWLVFDDHTWFAACCICRLIQLRLGHFRLWRLRWPICAPGLRVGLLLCVLHRLGRYPFFHWSTNNFEWARLVV